MEAHAPSGCQLRADMVSRQRCSVIAGMILFFNARRMDIREIKRACDWSNKNIAVFAGCSTEVQVAETDDTASAHIAKAGWTSVKALHFRAKLYHAKRHCRADKSITAPVHAQEGINVIDMAGSYLIAVDGGCLVIRAT